MKLKSKRRAATASILSLAVVLGVSSCSNDYTVAYLYMTTAKTLPHGLINGYQIDYQSGSLLPLDDSPIDAGGRNTVGLVVAPNSLYLYTVNHDDSDVVEFAIGTDGKLYPQNTYTITGSYATAAAIDAANKFLFVTFTYQNGPNNTELYTTANPGPGGITVFPINPASANASAPSENSLGAPVATVNVGRNPIGIVASPFNVPSGVSGCTAAGGCQEIFVIEQDPATTTSNLLGFLENPATGALTPLPGVTVNSGNVPSTGFASGPSPGGILANSTGSRLYVTDQSLDQVASYSVSSNGIPSPISGGTAATDSGPMGMAFDPSGRYLYVVAYSANTIDGYTLGSSGQPVRSTVSPTVATGTGPTCAATIGAPTNANPTHAIYLYTSNALSNNITAEQLNAQNGGLEEVQGAPFAGSTLPSCAVTVPAFPLR